MSEKAWAVLEGCEFREDIVEINFLDASRTQKVKKIDNTVVATYKKLIGLFMMIEPETLYGVPHLLLEDLVDGTIDRPTIYSIPMPIIMNARKINNRTQKTMSDVGFPVLAGKQVKVAQNTEGVGESLAE